MSRTRFPYERLLILLITLLAFGLRVWRLDGVPPGWRDDELINSQVISQHVLDGDWAVYFPDASGHEALYHTLNAAMLALFGPTVWGIRFLSVLLGTLTVPLTYLLGRKLFGSLVGLVAAAALALSFWSLMYSRIGLRHVLMPPLVLAAFYFFWRGLEGEEGRLETGDWRLVQSSRLDQSGLWNFLVSALLLALGMYTYFAARGVPAILVAFMGYLALFAWSLFRRRWWGFVALVVVTAVLSLPLILTLQQQPESEARVAELAVPLVEARTGNFAPLLANVTITLGMFHATGDGEWLYNIPDRPLFGVVGAVFFWGGVVIAAWYALLPAAGSLRALLRRTPWSEAAHIHLASAFLLLWWLAGIAPAFVSVPPASLGHTIVAQPAVFILLALPLGILDRRLAPYRSRLTATSLQLTALFLLLTLGWRDGQDYFVNWPERGMVRFLYRADIHEAAAYLNAHPDVRDVGLTSLLAGPWDQLALNNDLRTAVAPRWYNPDRALLLQPALVLAGMPHNPAFLPEAYTPVDERPSLGAYQFYEISDDFPTGEAVCFVNGLCVETAVYDPAAGRLTLVWRVNEPLDLPPRRLISNPPPPGVYAGPRLNVFAHLLDDAGNLLAGDDGLWVDVYSLQPGDRFAQYHQLSGPGGTAVSFGLYDPMTGARILTVDGRESVEIR
ncbi:MAG: glycosyltransferase family 39 protein [Ardenticatenaceae bacterium]|nr:glycosyltransferase family 39 protein [Ardenticatenaceae bacterium]